MIIWETDAPLGTDRRQEHLRRLNDLQKQLDAPGIHIRRLEVWVDGVEWTGRPSGERAIGDVGVY